MARMKSINYRRVTFSFPCAVLDQLRLRIDKNSMSSYVADAVKRDLLVKEELEKDTEEFIRSVRKFRKENKPVTKKSSLEMLREIRYGGKY